MARRRRIGSSGLIFHVVNRGAKRAALFETFDEYDDFERLLQTAAPRFGLAVFAYCLMPNHWHLVITSTIPGSLSRGMHWLTTTHARRWQIRRAAEGLGAVYQGRFKAIPVEPDDHFLRVCRYVERNALRAGLVDAAEAWRWSSLWQRSEGDAGWLEPWPIEKGDDWRTIVNTPQTDAELTAIRVAVERQVPFGDEPWKTALLQPPRKPGRPRRRSVLFK